MDVSGAPTNNPVSIRHLDALIVEDVEGDARLIVKALTRGGFSVNFERVESHAQMCAALDRRHWDVVISDCALPAFSAARALALLHERKLEELPVIVVSGVLREDASTQLFNAGAHDFLSKNNLGRLAPIVERELHSAARRTELLMTRQELERRVEQSESRFRNLFDVSPDGVVLVGAAGRITEINRRARAMFGYTSEQLIGVSIISLLPNFQDPSDRPTERDLAPANIRTLAMEGLRRDGQVFPVEVSIDAALADSGKTTIIAVRDATERQRHREELQLALAEARAIRDQLDSVVDCAPAHIIALDRNGAIEFINRAGPGQRKEDVIGADWLSFIPDRDRAQTREHLESVMRDGAPRSFELCVALESGTVWYSCYMGPLRSRGRINGAVIIAQEVTDVRRVQDELSAAQHLAAVGTLAAGIAHEINTPMQFVNDSLHFLRESVHDLMNLVNTQKALQKRVLDGAAAPALMAASAEVDAAEAATDLSYLADHVPKAFDRCIDGLERMTAIVRSLKEFAHPATQEAAAVDLNRSIQSTLTIVRNEYKYVADLQTDFADLPPTVCHVNDINQVVMNLVINAAHAIADRVEGSETKGLIRVTTRCENTSVVIAVSDTGTGIPEAIRHRIFEPFFTTKEVGKGTGQGLALAWAIVTEKHHGQLTFATELGRGTTFFVRLPVAGIETV